MFIVNNDAPDNGDFAAYLENLDRRSKTNATPIPAPGTTPAAFKYPQDEDVTDQERLRLQELAELPPISDDDLLMQALATAGERNEYDLDEKVASNVNKEGMETETGSSDGPGSEQATLAFLGEHALELADQVGAEELTEIPPITDEELMQQALAFPADEDTPPE
ncbi:hypothetical protein ACO0LD_00500 [Undibacterium sp. Ji83W]|uniref:hypothetical protein n=1 Tax=Undibacterium sp. Ji83W TaxID=3413043 RepID=UPI003BEF99BF